MAEPSTGRADASVSLLLNGEPLHYAGAADMTLLDWLRTGRGLKGTKEGCAEGDCGACTVVVGTLADGRVQHRAINACIALMPMLSGRSVWTVEGLAGPGGSLHPAAAAMIDRQASQCGFCTPGFVMSLAAAAMSDRRLLDRREIGDELAGNLCRCTGYGPIIEAARRMGEIARPDWESERLQREREGLASLAVATGATGEQPALLSGQQPMAHLPSSLDELDRLLASRPAATIVAGATDIGLHVTKALRPLGPQIHLDRVPELRAIDVAAGRLVIGAMVTYSQAEPVFAAQIPALAELVRRIGSRQVRNAGTIGGNIANGSPIGDMPPALIALGATLVLRAGGTERRIPLEDYFLAYGRQDRRPGEYVRAVELDLPGPGRLLGFHKVSKRFDQDISAVCGGFNIALGDDGTVTGVRIAYGGMAATPRRASHVEAALAGEPWTEATVARACDAYVADFTPITDMRASAGYRLEVARNLIWRVFHESRHGPGATRLVGPDATI
ncbi:MAG: xanthine dehydrogenase small subunit [Hyphomicrobiaceae bacterium]